MATSDYFNSCSTTLGISIPNTTAGYQETQNGNGYMGLAGYYVSYPQNGEPFLWVEYIQGSLIQSLENDTVYKATFYVNASDFNNIANKRIGIYFSSTQIQSSNTLPLYFEPQVMTSDFITDTLNWVKVSQYFVADGNEKFLTIGNFYDYGNLDTLVLEIDEPAFMISYYLIDNVSVEKVNINIPNVLTNNGDDVNDVMDFSFLPNTFSIRIMNRWGNLVFQSYETELIWNPSDLATGVYFYTLNDDISNKTIKSGFIQLIR